MRLHPLKHDFNVFTKGVILQLKPMNGNIKRVAKHTPKTAEHESREDDITVRMSAAEAFIDSLQQNCLLIGVCAFCNLKA